MVENTSEPTNSEETNPQEQVAAKAESAKAVTFKEITLDGKTSIFKKKFMRALLPVFLIGAVFFGYLGTAKNPDGSSILSGSTNITETSKEGGLSWQTNKFGAYSYRDDESVKLISEMVNSNGGDWGWILYPMNIKDRDKVNWNNAFGHLEKHHLIPIIQLVLEPGTTPTEKDMEGAAAFLDSLDWPVKPRFVSLFNEVNAAEYWGNKIDPEGHAVILDKSISIFKSKNSDFFIMNGAYNPSAKTGKVRTNLGVQTEYLDYRDYLERMDKKVPGIFAKLDGWAVHTYPQPEYKGKPLDESLPTEGEGEKGRNTMSSYKWELNFLKEKFDLEPPVFITETGWPHKEGSKPRQEWLSAQTVADYYVEVFEKVYLPDPRVVAVLPFGIKIEQLDNFSFVGKKGYKYPQFEALKSMSKKAGAPPLN